MCSWLRLAKVLGSSAQGVQVVRGVLVAQAVCGTRQQGTRYAGGSG